MQVFTNYFQVTGTSQHFRYIEQQLVAASQMPTWTNIAFHKYYAHGNPATAAGKY